MQPKILLVEDDETLGYLLQEFLNGRGFATDWAKDGVQALRHFNQANYDLCLLDVMMPALDGFTVAELFRKQRPSLPVVFLTAKSLHADVIRGFRAGADDYIKKPVDEEELVARIHAVLKRSAGGAALPVTGAGGSVFRIGDYIFDREKNCLLLGDEKTTLTDMETRLLALLCETPGQLVPRTLILEKIWDRHDFLARKSMDVFISRLRKYLSGDERVKIENVHGSGFVLVVPD